MILLDTNVVSALMQKQPDPAGETWLDAQSIQDIWLPIRIQLAGVFCRREFRLNFGRPAAVADFVRERVRWIELEAAATDPSAAPLLRALALLVQPEEQIPSSTAAIRAEVAGSSQEQDLADVIAATLISRFYGRSINQLWAMGSITVDEFSQSVAYREIFGQGRLEGRQEACPYGDEAWLT